MFVLYLFLSAAGLVGTWFYNLHFFAQDGASGGYLEALFANGASSSIAVDVAVVATAAIAFMIVEGRRLQMGITWFTVAATLPVALAFTFPLFLAFRHRRLQAMPAAPDARSARTGRAP